MDRSTAIKQDTIVWLKHQPYPFYFKGVSKKGKPILWGDFSGGQLGHLGDMEKEVEWDDVIYPIPTPGYMAKKRKYAIESYNKVNE